MFEQAFIVHTQRSTLEHPEVRPQSAERVQVRRGPEAGPPMVDERLVTHGFGEAEEGACFSAGEKNNHQ
ncbi:unnamed protein product [Nezara viridula]|uniref:Uncharacterized protein n=1 Tax=Nezara viridula TaxID=85310 RepID=A0A9P0H5S2_NEZVI|nr:unnamed protein product [Nezara viridula]